MSGKEQIIEVESLPEEIIKGATYSIRQANPNSYTHGMFKYPCKFIPEIPRWGINSYLDDENRIIFDPFSGSGTALLEANLHGYHAFGAEIDDIAKLITKVKTTPLDQEKMLTLDRHFKNIMEVIQQENSDCFRPDINNLEHWFSADAIHALGCMKVYIENVEDVCVRDFLKLCMVSIIKRVSNADDTSPKPYVSNKVIKVPPTVEKEFTSTYRRYRQMMMELSTVGNLGKTEMVDGDALRFSLPVKIDLAITSPPYINAFDYGRTMRLENLWMQTLTEEGLREKKKLYVGTEKIDVKKEKNRLDILEKSNLLKRYYDEIGKIDEKRALVVKKFFEDMEINLHGVYENLHVGAKYIIVIGNSSIRRIHVESWKVIEQVAHAVGFSTVQYFSYVIQNPYIRIPRKGMGGKISRDYVLVLERNKK